MFKGYLQSSILGKSIERDLNKVYLINFRDYALDKHKTCDDAPYGGGPGMLIKAEPLAGALDSIGASGRRVIYLTPHGKRFDQKYAGELAEERSLTVICGHYEGLDQRIIDLYVTDEISIGDYILFSGEVGAMVILDTIARQTEGVIKPESLKDESFSNNLLEYPQYTRPAVFRGLEVPDVLTSGNHKQIKEWRLKESLKRTLRVRPDLIKESGLNNEEKELMEIIKKEAAKDESH
jgi:tRNA (guanine37-N1)-methyltransferase